MARAQGATARKNGLRDPMTVGSLPTQSAAGRGAVATVAAGTFLALVVFTLPLADLPTLARALAAGRTAQAWILSSMSVGLAASMLLAGALADDRGRRRMFAAGGIGMALGSLICALAFGPVVFVAGRIVQGIGGSALIAAGLALLSAWSVDAAQQSRATALWGTSVGAGIAVGPVLAGGFDLLGWWREIYVVIVIASLMLYFVVHRLSRVGSMPESRAERPRALDLLGAIAFTAAMTMVLVGLTEIRQPGGRVLAVIILIIAVGCAAAFVIIEQRVGQPMINFSFFAEPRFAAASLAGLITGIGVIGQMSVTSSYLVRDLGLLPIGAAGLLALWAATSAITALLSRRLPPFASGPRQLVIGLVGVSIGLALLIGATRPTDLVVGLFVAGLASGVLNAALGREAVLNAPDGRAGLGSGVNNTARYLGSALGVTLTSILVLGGGPDLAQAESGWSTAALVTSAASLVGALLIGLLLLRAAAVSGRAASES